MDEVLDLRNPSRECGGCTACCEGHLFGQAHGLQFYAGRPCHFKGKDGCTIYKDRPEDPCKTFKCAWLVDDRSVFPEWMRPDKSGVIVQVKYWGENKDKQYLYISECGEPVRSEILNWIFTFHVTSQIPISVQVNRGWTNYGPIEFIQELSGK